MSKEINLSRRWFVCSAAMSIAAAQLGMTAGARAEVPKPQSTRPNITSRTNLAFGPLKQIDAGVLSIGYAEAGPPDGPAVILLHGWPYDLDSFVDVAPLLASAGYRVIAPYLRGYGTTRFLSPDSPQNRKQPALALDLIALMDALKIEKAVVAGFDWSARVADTTAALWPERCKAAASVSGYLVVNLKASQQLSQSETESQWWYQYYFATQRGRVAYEKHPDDLNQMIWRTASPQWHFDDAAYARSAEAFNYADHVAIVTHNYRWRLVGC